MSDLVQIVTPLAEYPLWCRFNSSDVPTFGQIFISREYSPLDELSISGLVLDCGANVGYSSAYFLSRFPRAQVIAVEPDPANFEMLRRNLAPYGRRGIPVRAGIWSHCCFLNVADRPYRDGREWSRQVQAAASADDGAFPGVDISSLLQASGHQHISLLKMDIEGAEAAVFGSNCESWLGRVDAIAIELHDDSQFGPATPVFYRAIDGQDFKVCHSGELVICTRASLQCAAPAPTAERL